LFGQSAHRPHSEASRPNERMDIKEF
jgi:hypothetical protein